MPSLGRSLYWVYPRPRGGTISGKCRQARERGLSPPTRGNPVRRERRQRRLRSIPAHAGEPVADAPRPLAIEVYPRPRGGTRRLAIGYTRTAGLSPPTRGNRGLTRRPFRLSRSIPAHAGEPPNRDRRRPATGVYPRPPGGTIVFADEVWRANGLSPPTRGEPKRSHCTALNCRVYPRPRGGTLEYGSQTSACIGLSPPTRGNPGRTRSERPAHGSIPAHAGEPGTPPIPTSSSRVYPRPRGGTRSEIRARWLIAGLSPPTRGNRRVGRAG